MKLAQSEGHRPVFKCGAYEVLKLLLSSLKEIFEAYHEEDAIKVAMVRNCWTVLRPQLSQGTFVRVSEQPWAKDLQQGSHRLRQSWVEKRFDNLDGEGHPKPPAYEQLPEAKKDVSYHSEEPGQLSELRTWQLMVESGEMTPEALRQCSEEPWIEMEVQGLLDFGGLLDEAKELLVSPKQRRIRVAKAQAKKLAKAKAQKAASVEGAEEAEAQEAKKSWDELAGLLHERPSGEEDAVLACR